MMMMFRTAASVMVAAWSQFSSTLLQRLDLVKAECQGEASDGGRRIVNSHDDTCHVHIICLYLVSHTHHLI